MNKAGLIEKVAIEAATTKRQAENIIENLVKIILFNNATL